MTVEPDLGPGAARFRAEMRGWINETAPVGLREIADWSAPGMGGSQRGEQRAIARRDPLFTQWERRLLEERLICAQWPQEYGGRGLTAVQAAIFNEECHAAGVPRVDRWLGEILVGPAVMAHGTPEQKAYFLPRIISGEDFYCQGYSEPNHGSDLAAVETRGVVHDDQISITGQKVWTSRAYEANMIFILCRTDPTVPRHKGLSYVLAPIRRGEGIQIRPIRQLSGVAEFCEVFLDELRAPLFNVIGGLNNGWIPAMTTLGYERGGDATLAHVGFDRELRSLIEVVREQGRADDPVIRQQIAWAYTHVSLMRFAGLRLLANLATDREPGPEASVAKLFWSEYHQRFADIALDVLGAQGILRPPGDGYVTTPWQDVYFSSKAQTIYSGTSEIQRNIIGERALGLPKDPPHPRR
jgi:alkylation response protein AidB-like acyl-CoA dehydrogenase